MTRRKILIVEDDSIMALELQETLQDRNYVVPGVAYTGKDAIEMSKKINPDLIVMDIRLKGGIDGIEAANKIRAISKVPVLFLSGYADKGTLARIKECGAAGLIAKPFDIAKLIRAIDKILTTQR